MVLTRSMSKKTTHNKSAVGVAETSSKKTRKKETRIKAKSGETILNAELLGEAIHNPKYAGYYVATGIVCDRTIMHDAFVVFMKENFLKGYWEKNPGIRMLEWDVNVAGNEKWRSMSDSERAYYVKLVKERKAEIFRKWKNGELH